MGSAVNDDGSCVAYIQSQSGREKKEEENEGVLRSKNYRRQLRQAGNRWRGLISD